jgi:hypothetical protein
VALETGHEAVLVLGVEGVEDEGGVEGAGAEEVAVGGEGEGTDGFAVVAWEGLLG